jgi:hypothetical protein
MSYRRTYPTIAVIRKDGTVTTYTYYHSSSVGRIRKGDALLINAGEAVAYYPHHPTLTFDRAAYYKDAKKWYVKSKRSRSVQ